MSQSVRVFLKNGPFSKKWVQYVFCNVKPADDDEGHTKITIEKDDKKPIGETDTDVWYRSDPDSYEGCYNRLWDHAVNMGHDIKIDV